MANIEIEQVIENEMTLEKIQVFMKTMKPTELVALMNSSFSILAKQAKAMEKVETQAEKKKTARKNPNQGKQLQKPRAWVNYVHKYAQVNGWESFIVEKDGEEIVMPGSMEHNGAHVFENSITEKKPYGQKLILKDAMSLSKVYRTSKPELYAEFEAQYEESDSEVVAAVADATKAEKPKVVVRKTAAEKEAEKAAKQAEKEAEKAAKKAEKEAEKAAKQAEKEAEKEAKKAEKEAEKAAKQAEKEAKKSPKSSPKSAAVIPKAAVAAKAVPVASKAATPAVSTDKPKKSADEWVAPPAGKCAPFTFKGKKYIRSSDDEMWTQGADGGAGDWVGVFDPKTNKIDTSVADPYADEEDDE
jgi:hypothetical protein